MERKNKMEYTLDIAELITRKTKYTKVLTKQEIKDLDKVKTTKEDATIIRTRNIAALDYLRYLGKDLKGHWKDCLKNKGLEARTFLIPCPHCDYTFATGFNCDSCAWDIPQYRYKIVETPKGLLTQLNCFCCLQTFGGIKMAETKQINKPSFISYTAKGVLVGISAADTFKELQKKYKNTEIFLLGHIQWAERVLAQPI